MKVDTQTVNPFRRQFFGVRSEKTAKKKPGSETKAHYSRVRALVEKQLHAALRLDISGCIAPTRKKITVMSVTPMRFATAMLKN